jgi:hypothetical protein
MAWPPWARLKGNEQLVKIFTGSKIVATSTGLRLQPVRQLEYIDHRQTNAATLPDLFEFVSK